MKKEKSIIVMTATGQGNLGDELILATQIRLLRDHIGKKPVIIFSHNIRASEDFLKFLGVSTDMLTFRTYFPNNIRKQPFRNMAFLFQTLVSMFRSDVVIIGGGGLLYDPHHEGWRNRPVRLWKMRVALAQLCHTLIVYWSLGISTKEEISSLFPWGSVVTVRDKKSKALLEAQGIECHMVPDPVLLHDVVPSDRHAQRKIGLALRRKWLSPSHLREVVGMLRTQGYEVIGLAHSLHPEDTSLDDAKWMEEIGIPSTHSLEETLQAYTDVGLVISNRLHGVVLSFLHDIPVMPVSVNEKIQQMTTLIGVPSYETLDADKVQHFLASPPSYALRQQSLSKETLDTTKKYILEPLCDLL